KAGKVKLVVSKEEDGFHFYVTNKLDWSDMRVLKTYRVRHTMEDFYRDLKTEPGVRGASDAEWPRSHYTLAPGLHRLYIPNPPTSIRKENLKPLGKVPHHVGRHLPLGEASMLQEACGPALRKIQASEKARNHLPQTKNIKTQNFSYK
ncbi:MAG: hypothetical protein ACPL07_00730, partial [Candidatus Bathyarchaeia archaeon]